MKAVTSPWSETFDRFARSICRSAIIVAPYITHEPLEQLASRLGTRPGIQVSLLTNLAPDSLLQGSLDTKAISDFCRKFSRTTVHHLPGLHAKVYVADQHTAIVTSGNLTGSSLHANFEYGIQVLDPRMVGTIAKDLIEYRTLGASVSVDELDTLTEAARSLKDKYAQTLKSTRSTLRREFDDQLEATHESLRQLRGKPGESTNSIFVRTLLYLLSKEPMETQALHLRIRSIHPDLCDDQKDRIINGVRFGREWKHRVRGAQVDLRRKGMIELIDGKWRIVR